MTKSLKLPSLDINQGLPSVLHEKEGEKDAAQTGAPVAVTAGVSCGD